MWIMDTYSYILELGITEIWPKILGCIIRYVPYAQFLKPGLFFKCPITFIIHFLRILDYDWSKNFREFLLSARHKGLR